MKRLTIPLIAALCTALIFSACKKETKAVTTNEISEATLSQIQALGFSTQDAQKRPNGYLVEGDIFLSESQLNSKPSSPNLVIAKEEQYRTFNLVNNSYTEIKIALNSTSAQHNNAFNAALDEAITRYNNENLRFTFTKVAPDASPNITVVAFYEKSNVLGSSGFPSSTGTPYNQIQMNTYWYSVSTDATNVNYIATIMAHELGHCIGFRHTDYMDRSFSCGGRKQNEEKPFPSGYGAIQIPGTPSGPDAASWMLACIGSNVNRPFNANDKIALANLY
jgi:hypothetical protein